jgi:hypothetical protein
MIVVYQFEHLFPEKAIQCRQKALRSQRWKALGGNFLEKFSLQEVSRWGQIFFL